MEYLPLQGVKVLDMSRLVAGAVSTRALAGFGADVVKVETPGVGDNLRLTPPFVDGESAWHLLLNRGKRSIALDLRSEAGMRSLLALAEVADVVVEVSRPGRLKEMGFDIASLRDRRPDLIVCSITGFGQTGPFSSLPAHGLNVEALSASLPIERHDGRPVLGDMRHSGGMALELAGTHAALAIAAALVRVRTTGEGAWVDVSCWDAAVEAKRLSLALAAARRGASRDQVEPWKLGPLYDLYDASDGAVIQFCAVERKFWDAFCRGVGRPDLEELWTSDAAYWFGDPTMRPLLEDLFASQTAERWFADAMRWGVPLTPVLSVDDLLDHPHLAARGLLDDDGQGPMPAIAGAVRWIESDSRPGRHADVAPAVGADSASVLEDWCPPQP